MLPSLFTRQVAYRIFVKQFYIVSTAVILLLLVMGWLLVLKPTAEQVRMREEEIEKRAVALSESKRRSAEITGILESLDRISVAERSKIEASILENIDRPSLWVYFDTLAEESGVSLDRLEMSDEGAQPGTRRGDPKNEGGVSRVPVQIVVKGSGYATLKKFLTSLERSLPLIDVRSFEFKPESESLAVSVEMYKL